MSELFESAQVQKVWVDDNRLRKRRLKPHTTGHLDEVYLKIDSFVSDSWLPEPSQRRDVRQTGNSAAAIRSFTSTPAVGCVEKRPTTRADRWTTRMRQVS